MIPYIIHIIIFFATDNYSAKEMADIGGTYVLPSDTQNNMIR